MESTSHTEAKFCPRSMKRNHWSSSKIDCPVKQRYRVKKSDKASFRNPLSFQASLLLIA